MKTKRESAKLTRTRNKRYNNNVKPRRITGLIYKTIIVNIRATSRSTANKSTYQ